MSQSFRVVDDELRLLATQGRWTDAIAAVSIGRTIFLPFKDSKAAANALSQAMRNRGMKLRRKTIIDNGEKGTIFWADKKLGA